MTRFSIILPLRNGGVHLRECIGSILSQTLPDFNLIILDNNSTDGSREWLLGLNDDRIKLYTSDRDLSIEENWARIVTIPKNEFITLIGHDDILYPDYLAVMSVLIEKYPDASLYQTHFNYIDNEGKPVRPCKSMKAIQCSHEFLSCQFYNEIDSTGTGYMMRSRDYDEVGGISSQYPRLIYADYELWIKLMHISYKATSSSFSFSYRVHASASSLTNGEDYLVAFEHYIRFLIQCQEEDKQMEDVIQKAAGIFLMENCRALSHRLLKTTSTTRKTTVIQLVKKIRNYAAQLIPGQSFRPYLNAGIVAAALLDNKPGLLLFSLYQRIVKRNKKL